MATYIIREEGYDFATIEANSGSEALDQAKEEFLGSGDYDTSHGTIWVRWYAIDEAGDVEVSQTIQIDPEEPDVCTDTRGHDWQSPYSLVGGLEENPGVRGHGGGVVIEEVCMHCGCSRVTNTWAQDPTTGEQGLESVRYEPGKFALEVSELQGESETSFRVEDSP